MGSKRNRKETEARQAGVIEMTECQLNKAIENAVSKIIAPLKEEIQMLKTEVLELTKSQQFVSTKYDDLCQNYLNLLASCKQKEDEIKQLGKNATSTQIKNEEDKQKIDDIDL